MDFKDTCWGRTNEDRAYHKLVWIHKMLDLGIFCARSAFGRLANFPKCMGPYLLNSGENPFLGNKLARFKEMHREVNSKHFLVVC